MKRALAIMACLGMLLVSARAEDQIDSQKRADFWKWFTPHAAEFAQALAYKENPTDADKAMRIQDFKEIAAHLKEVHAAFVPYFKGTDKSNTMMVSVQGQSGYFPQVEQFVKEAPAISGWQFQALKSPVDYGPDTEIQTGSISFKMGDLRYSLSRTGTPGMVIVVYFPLDVTRDQKGFDGLAGNLVEDALGEKLSGTLVRTVTAKQLSSDSPKDLKPFIGLYSDASSK